MFDLLYPHYPQAPIKQKRKYLLNLRLKNKKVSLVETQDFASRRRKWETETQDFASLQSFPNKFGPQSKNLAF